MRESFGDTVGIGASQSSRDGDKCPEFPARILNAMTSTADPGAAERKVGPSPAPIRLRRRDRDRRAADTDLTNSQKKGGGTQKHHSAPARPSLPWPNFASLVAHGRFAIDAKGRAMKTTYDFDRIRNRQHA